MFSSICSINSLIIRNKTVSAIPNTTKGMLIGSVYGQELVYSYNGFTWYKMSTYKVTSGTIPMQHFAYNGSVWVGVGYYNSAGNANIRYSYDGFNWSPSVTQPFGTQGYCVIWVSSLSLFFAAGSGASANVGPGLLYSSDGINWTLITNTSNSHFYSYVIFDGSYIVGLQYSGVGKATADGITSYSIASPNNTPGAYNVGQLQAIAYSPTLNIYVISANTTASNQLLWSNSIGGAWTVSASNFGANAGGNVIWVPFANIFVVAVNTSANIGWSIDGKTWTIIGTNFGISTLSRFSITNDMIFIAHNFSYDGKTWFSTITKPIFTGQILMSCWNNIPLAQPNLIVSAGTGTRGLAYSLNGGMTWTGVTASLLTNAGSTVAYNGSSTSPLWLAGGQGPTFNMVYSTNGISWTGIASTFTTSCKSIAYSAQLGRWTAVGQGTNTIMYSTTGISGWTAAALNAFSGIGGNSVVWNGSMFLAVGIGNTTDIATSSDGINWTGQRIFEGGSAYGGFTACWNGSIWIIGGSTNKVTSMYYSTNSSGTAWLPVVTASPLFTTCYSIAWNGTIYVAVGSPATNAITNSIAYSNDGTTWIGITGKTIFDTAGYSVIWNGSCFLASGQDAADYYAYSITGYNGWTGLGKGAFTTSVNALCWNQVAPELLTVASGSGGNTLAYSNDGINWTGLGVTIFGANGYSVAYNGAIYVAGGQGGNTMAYSYNGINWTGTVPFSTRCTGIPVYANEIATWVTSGQGTNNIMWSTNGISWTGVTGTAIFSVFGTDAVWNGSIFVATGHNTASGISANSIATSPDGKTWTLNTVAKFNIGGRCVVWNGSIWLVGGYGSTTLTPNLPSMYTSSDGFTWTSVSGMYAIISAVYTIAWNGTMFVAGGQPNPTNGHAIAYSYNGTTWTGVTGTTLFAVQAYGIKWNASLSTWIAAGSGSSSIAYSADGISWTAVANSINIFSSGAYKLTNNSPSVIPQIAYTAPTAPPTTPFFVAGGQGGNTLAYSVDCITWTGLGALTFTTVCNQVAFNGLYNSSSRYVAVGQGTNTIAYSSDGLFWTGVTSTPFSTAGNSIAYSPTINMWTAAGSGGNTLAWSSDGISWNGLLSSTFTNYGSCVMWDSSLSLFLAGGSGGNTIAYCSDGYSWTGLGTSVFATNCNAFSYSGSIIVAGGSGGNTLARSTSNPPSFSAVTNSTTYISTSCFGIGWNGTIFVASGQGTNGANSLATSTDGSTWTSVTSPFTGAGSMSNNIIWNGLYWSLTGKSTGNTQAYSVNGSTWYGQGITKFSTQGFGICSNGVTATTDNVSTIAGQDTINSLAVYSFDLNNWTTVSDASNIFIIAYNGTMWIGYISSTQLAYSTNLKNWTHITSSFFSAAGQYGIAWSPTLKLWAANNNLATNNLAWSTDGINWTTSNSKTLFSLGTIVTIWVSDYNMFLVGGNLVNAIAYSTDGKIWTGCGSGFSLPQMRSVSSNGSKLIAVGGNGANNIATSTDGIVWTTVATGASLFGTNAWVNGSGWNGSMWVVGGQNVNANYGTIITSPDGITWTNRTNTLFTGVGSAAGRVIWINSLSLWTVGGGGPGTTNVMATSPNGINWTGKSQYQVQLYNGVLSTYDTSKKTMIVAVGRGTNTIAYSFDGVKWNGLGTSIFSTYGVGIAYNGNMWVAVGSGTNTIAYSYNGINWIGLGNIMFSTLGYNIKWSPKLKIWVAVGQGGNTIAYSYTGTNWTGIGITIFSTICQNLAWSPQLSLFVATGYGVNSLATSSNGILWTAVPSSTITFNTQASSCCWNGSIFIAVGQTANTIATSTNGTTWTGQGNNVFSSGYGVNFNGQLTVAVGQGGNTIAYSSNGGTSWTGQGNVIFSTYGYGVKWINSVSLWIACGYGGNSIATSPNGTSWTGLGLGIFSTNGYSVEWNGI